MRQGRTVVTFGSSRVGPSDPAYRLAREVGRLLGERGLVTVSGGYQGTMGAVSEGARQAGGRVVGVTTRVFTQRTPNPHLHEERVEDDYPSRLATLVTMGDAYIALPGGLGTLSEWVTAWCLATIDQLGGPLWVFEDPWRPLAERILELPEAHARMRGQIGWVATSDDLAAELDRWVAAERPRTGPASAS